MEPNNNRGIIRETIASLENNLKVLEKWKEYTTKKEAFAVAIVKIDVSMLPIEAIEENCKEFENRLFSMGASIYSIDYTKDFSGTMQREKLVQHLIDEHEFKIQNNGEYGYRAGTILDNTDSVGNNVLSYIWRKDGIVFRTKLYNKIVSKLEAGEVRNKLGGHIADYAKSSNTHLKKVFSHPDVKTRGCTRVEITAYGTTLFSKENGTDLILESLANVSEKQLFVIQPAIKQWENLAENIDRCFVLGDIPQKKIYIGWCANTKTKRIAGIYLDCKNGNLEKWDKIVRWAIGDFGFKNCPIFFTNILSTDKDLIQLSPLQCFYKGKETKTILAPCNTPKKVYKDPPKIEDYLPSNNICSFEWRKKKCQNILIRKSEYKIVEDHSILIGKKISTLSTKNRAERLLDLLDAEETTLWADRIENYLESIQEKQEKRKEELKTLAFSIRNKEKRMEESKKRYEKVCSSLSKINYTKITGLENTQWNLLGFRIAATKQIVVLENKEGEIKTTFASPKLTKTLKQIEHTFEYKEDNSKRLTFWYTPTSFFGEETGEIY